MPAAKCNPPLPSAMPAAMQRLRASARHLPERPGVYIMKDASGRIVYVGKAVNLKRRVFSYSTPSALRDPKVSKLVSQVDSLSYVETPSELEALLVESRLIKAEHPVFNRRLTEPESCCFLRADFREELPGIEVVTRREDDGASYLGPFWRTSLVQDAADAVADAYLLRRCSGSGTAGRRTCFYHDLRKCSGPCGGAVSAQEYLTGMRSAWETLSSRTEEVIRRLTERRDSLSESLRFEEAERVHRQIRGLEHVWTSHLHAMQSVKRFAVTIPSYLKGRPVVLLFSDGRLVGKLVSGPRAYPDTEMLAGYVDRIHSNRPDLLPGRPSYDDLLIIRSYLFRKELPDSFIPIPVEVPTREFAGSLHAHVDTLRRS